MVLLLAAVSQIYLELAAKPVAIPLELNLGSRQPRVGELTTFRALAGRAFWDRAVVQAQLAHIFLRPPQVKRVDFL